MRYFLQLLVFGAAVIMFGCTRQSDKYISGLEMLEGGKVFAVPSGTAADQFVLKRFPDAKFEYYNTPVDCALAVQKGKADAAVYDKPVLLNIAAKNTDLTVIEEVIATDQYGYAVQKDNTALKKVIDEVLAEIKANGTYDDMMKRWFPERGNPAPMPEIKSDSTGGVLRLATSTGVEPMSFVNADRKIVGFDIEFASYIAQKLGKRLEVIDFEFGAMLPALIAGKVDMIGAGLSITEERAKQVLFSECYFPGGLSALVKKDVSQKNEDKAQRLSSVEDLKDKRIGVLLGSVQDMYVHKNFTDAEVRQYQNITDMLLALNGEKVDAIFLDETSFTEASSEYKDFGVLASHVFDSDIAAGFNQESDELREKFNSFLKEIRADGTYEDMLDRYVNKGNYQMPEIKSSNSNGTLKVGVMSDSGLPFTGVKDGELIGFDIELAKRFAAYAGLEFKPLDIQFPSMIASVVTNKIDIILCCIMITEEREKQIDFSDPYYNAGTSAVVKKKFLAGPSDQKNEKKDYLSGSKVGVFSGSVQDQYMLKNYPSSEVFIFDNSTDIVLSLKTNKVDALLVPGYLAGIYEKHNPDLTVVETDVNSMSLGVGFRKDNPALRDEFNSFLQSIKDDGTYDEMSKRWFKGDAENVVMPPFNNPVSDKILKVAVSVEHFPFVSIKDGDFYGFDIEMIRRFAERANYKLEMIEMNLPALINSLVAKKADMISTGICITEERKKQIDFSDPYHFAGSSVIIRRGDIEQGTGLNMSKVEDIDGKRVGVFSGTVHDKFVSTNYPNSKILLYDNTADMMISLKTGKIDAIMIATATADLLLKHNDDLVILNRELFPMPLGVGFRKESGELRKQFNQFLSDIRSNGTYDEMAKRWFIDDAEKAVMPPFKNPVSDKKLTVAVSIEDLPYVAYMNGEYVGFDIEMIQKFAEWGNFNLKIIEIDFPGLINALVAKKVDMITDGIAISEERQKQIDFSDAYSNLNSAVMIKKSDMAGYVAEDEKPVKKTFFKLVSESFHNNIILEKRYLLILNGLKVTIIISILAALLGTVIGGLICWMRMAKNKLLSYTASLLINLVRGTPVLVLLMIIFYVIFASVNINPVIVAVIAFGINFGAYVSEMFRTSIEGVDRGQQEAGIASGFSKVQTFVNIIMPQALRQVLPVYKGEFISLLKATSIVGYIAVQDLTKASDIIRSRTFDAFFPLIMAAVLYILIAWLLTTVLDRVEISVDPKRKRQKRIEEVNL